MEFWFWTLLEVAFFFSQIWGVVIFVLVRQLSPFKVYQYYLIKMLKNKSIDKEHMWGDRKPTE